MRFLGICDRAIRFHWNRNLQWEEKGDWITNYKMKLLRLVAAIFGILSGVFIFNRFYDLLPHTGPLIAFFVIAYCCHSILIIVFGLYLFNKQKQLGLWILILFPLFIIFRHGIQYWEVTQSVYNIQFIPGMPESLTIPYLNLIFILEIATGIFTIYLAYRTRREWTRTAPVSK